MPYVQLPDGSNLEIPAGVDYVSAMEAAKQQFPEAFGIKRQHGFMPAAKAAWGESIASGIKGIAGITGSETLGEYGKKYAEGLAKEQAVPGAYQPMTGEEEAAAYEKGMLPGAAASLTKRFTEPVGGIVGGFALPTLAGAAAGMAAAPFLPEEAAVGAFGLGARALSGLAKGAAFTGTEALPETGRNIARQEVVQREAINQGLPAPEIDVRKAAMTGLVQGAIIPVLGHLGGYVANDVLKLLGPEIAATTEKVIGGQMTQEAAIASLNSITKNVLVRMGETAAVGASMMGGTEALRMAQAGEDVTSPEGLSRIGGAAEEALALAPIGGAFGAFGRRGQVKQIERAGEQFGQNWQEAHGANAALDQAQAAQQAQEAAVQKWAAAGVDTTIPMEFGKMPKAKTFPELQQAEAELQYLQEQGAPLDVVGAKQEEIDALKKRGPVGVPPEEPAVPGTPVETIQRSYMNALGVPNKSPLRDYVGKPWGEAQADLRSGLEALIEPDTKGVAWLDKQPKDGGLTPRQKIERELTTNPKLQLQETVEAPRAPEQSGFGFPTPEEQQNQALAAETARRTEKAAATRAATKVAKTPGAVRDIFTGEPSVVDVTKPAEVPEAPSRGAPEARMALKDRLIDLYAAALKTGKPEDLAAWRDFNKAARLNIGEQPWLHDTKNELIPPSEEASRAAWEAEQKGALSEHTREPSPAATPAEGGAGVGVSVPERAESKPPAEQRRVVGDERPVEPSDAGKGVELVALKEAPRKPTKKQLAELAATEEAQKERGTGLGANMAAAAEAGKKEAEAGAMRRSAYTRAPGFNPDRFGEAGKPEKANEYTPAFYKLDAPEHRQLDALGKPTLDAKGKPKLHSKMTDLWWEDLADMFAGVARGDKEAIKAYERGIKNKTFTEAQFKAAEKTNAENLKRLRKTGTTSSAMEAARLETAAGETARRGEAKTTKEAVGAIEEGLTEREATAAQLEQVAHEEEARSLEEEQDPDAFMYSEAPTVETPTTEEDATAKLKATFDSPANFDRIVKVYATQAEAAGAHPNIKGLSEKGTRVAGFTTKDGKIGIVAENIQKGHELGVFLHEAGVHLGMEKLVGADNMAWLHDRIQEWAKKDDGSVESEAAKAALDRAEKSKTDNNAEGRIAYMTEELVNRGVQPRATTPGGTWMQRFVGFAKLALIKLGLKSENFSGQNLVDLAYGAARMELKNEAGRELTEPKLSEVKTAHKEPKFSDDIPAKTRVTLEHEGADGEPVIVEVNAKTEMRAVERRRAVLEKLLGCVANA